MLESQDPQPGIPVASPKKKGAKKKARTRPRSYVHCAICHERLPYLTVEHLQLHGYSLERYQRTFLVQTSAPTPRSDLVRILAHDLATHQEFVNILASEVAEAIFSGTMRDRLRTSLASVVGTRLQQHGESVAALAKIRKELSAPWRVEQGGELGKPTETRELVNMAALLHAEVAKGEELLLKTVKLAIEERKGLAAAGAMTGGLAPYTGAAEVIPIPPELSPGEREDIRLLFTELTRSVMADRDATVRTLNVERVGTVQESVEHLQDSDSVPPPPTPLPVPAAPTLPTPHPPTQDDIDPFAM